MDRRVDTTIYGRVVTGLKSIGYGPELIAEPYAFPDWFAGGDEVRVDAAIFSHTPWDYESACMAVVRRNGYCGQALVDRCRALGAPFVLELADSGVIEWAVSRKEGKHQVIERYSPQAIERLFQDRSDVWKPDSLLRDKNIGEFQWIQAGLFDGLVPELEDHIQAKLDPLLTNTLSATSEAYREQVGGGNSAVDLFKLVFWLLTAKVFHDRRVPGFKSLGPDADACLSAVSRHYAREFPLLLNKAARSVAVKKIWSSLDFRNLSVEVLAQIWSTTLVDVNTKQRLGIHRTPRSIVKYIVDRIPFESTGDEGLAVLEPCCGSAGFLIGAMSRLRRRLFEFSPRERHRYFVKHLSGIEEDPFSAEISFLALTLADFPNPNGWDVVQGDVFADEPLRDRVSRAGVVLCNPPFGEFTPKERKEYRSRSHRKPAELLHRILDNLHPRGVLGFVLPRAFVDGSAYSDVRARLSERFESLDITILPDKAFPSADSESALLVATNPVPHRECRIINNRVNDDGDAWARFELLHTVSSENTRMLTAEQARTSVVVPELQEVWEFMLDFPRLGDVAELHRGIEWDHPLTKNGRETGYRSEVIHEKRRPNTLLGVPPRTSFNVFEVPSLRYLDVSPDKMRGHAYELQWTEAKAIVNKTTRSRGRWRLAAFPATAGVACYQTYTGIWPTGQYDEFVLAAIINSPVANAFVATREGKTDIKVRTLRQIPVPNLTPSQAQRIQALVGEYQRTVAPLAPSDASRLLMEIDAVILDGYSLPARLEVQLLEFFSGYERSTPFEFPPYFPADLDVYFNLSDYLSPDFQLATSGELLKRMSS